MNKEIKEKWVSALRSGEYKQTKRALCKIIEGEKSYCCLGVLCDLALKEKVVYVDDDKDWAAVQATRYYNGSNTLLPKEVMEWAGLAQADPRVPSELNNHSITLSGLNDRGHDFEDIAKIIEERL